MNKILGALAPLLFILSGCSTLQSAVETMFAEARQPATQKPLWYYKADLQITVDGTTFDGVGVTAARKNTMLIDVESEINMDRVEVETCGRNAVCEQGKKCPSEFNVDQGWWGTAGKHMTYKYTPVTDEAAGSCAIYVKVFSKAALAAWGYLALRAPDETLPAHLDCNGISWKFAGHSICQTKEGLIQRLTFDTPVDDFDVDKECGLTQIDKQTFELRPSLRSSGPCTGKFLSKGKWHGLEMFGYHEVLVGGS